jgi:hypothetical protein
MIDLWLDDTRDPVHHGYPDYVWVKTVKQAKQAFETSMVRYASLDHDLGVCATCTPGTFAEHSDILIVQSLDSVCDPKQCKCDCHETGYDLVCWMEEFNHWPEMNCRVHSMNPVGRQKMQIVIDKHYR